MTPAVVEALRRRFFGRDDVVILEDRSVHIAAWERRGRVYVKGAEVPHMENKSSYSVLSREGLWLHVAKGKIASASRKPVMGTQVSLWGRVISGPGAKIRMRRRVRIKERD